MSAAVEKGDLPKIARGYGESGKPEPDWAKADPQAHAAYRAGAGLPDDTPAPTPQSPVKHPQTNPSRKGGTRSPGRPRAGRKTPGRPGGRTKRGASVGDKISRTIGVGGGTGGGLLLAVFAYPLGLSILKNGPSGAGLWLRAKFLNQVPAQPVQGQTTNPNAPYYDNPKAKPGQPGSGKWPDGRPIPGYPQPLPPGAGTA